MLPGKRKEKTLNKNMRNTAILLVVFLAVYMFGNYFAEKSLMSGGRSSSTLMRDSSPILQRIK